MSATYEYRCLGCLDGAVTRDYDVAHLSRTCESCGEFERFVNGAVLEQFEEFEESPPEDFDWERLDRTEKFMVAERLVRTTRTLDDFSIETFDDGDGTDDADGEGESRGDGDGTGETDDAGGREPDPEREP